MPLAFDIGSHLDTDPNYWDGRPFIRGKRVTVHRIGICYSQGQTAEEIAADRNLELPEVYAALTYYLANREAIDEDVRRYDEEYMRLAAEKDAAPASR